MKKLMLFCMLLSTAAFAQKVKLVEGSLAPLKGQTSIQVDFTYDNLSVGDMSEDAYIKKKKSDYNAKEPGRGEKWEKAWYDDRKARFEPRFIELYEKHAKMSTKTTNSTYVMIFHTTSTEPGWNVGVARASARIDAEVTIKDRATDKVIAKITVTNAPGAGAGGYDFDSGLRIQEAYAKSGKEIGQLITKANK